MGNVWVFLLVTSKSTYSHLQLHDINLYPWHAYHLLPQLICLSGATHLIRDRSHRLNILWVMSKEILCTMFSLKLKCRTTSVKWFHENDIIFVLRQAYFFHLITCYAIFVFLHSRCQFHGWSITMVVWFRLTYVTYLWIVFYQISFFC